MNILKSFVVSIVILFAAVSGFAQADTPANRRAAFDKVWNTVNDKHFDPTFGGVDWKKVRDEYRPRAEAAKSLDDFYAVLRQMLGELRLSHFGVFPPGPVVASDGASGEAGVEIKQIGADLVVFRVAPDSPAAKAGVRPGLAIRSVGGRDLGALLATFEKTFAERGYSEAMRKVFRERIAERALDGEAGTSVEIVAADAKGRARRLRFARFVSKGDFSQALGNFPPQPVVFESKRLPGNVGYIRFSMWVMPQLPKIRAAVKEFADADAIVFDLRGNPGGIGGIANGVAGLLVREQGSIGSMRGRGFETNLVVYPQPEAFAGKVVVLMDHGSGSTSEMFAAGLQDMKRATIVGETSAGAILPSVFDTLPTGAVFQYAISDYRSPSNVLIEGRGVAPDIAASPTRADLLAGRDNALDAALRFIAGNK